MNWAYLSVLLAGVLPVLCAGIAKAGFKQYDNNNPRAWLAKQTGFRARANAAQANSFEAFPFFATGVLLAVVSQVNSARIDILALGFLLARIAYIVCYLANKPTWRSIFWAVGFFCTLALFVSAFRPAI